MEKMTEERQRQLGDTKNRVENRYDPQTDHSESHLEMKTKTDPDT
jgi:hypothetical protein